MTTYPMKLTCTKCGAVDEGTLHIEDSKPLTDEQLNTLADNCTPNTETGALNYRVFARAIEAAHGIKEQP